LTLIGEAVFARCLSSLRADRQLASTVLPAGTQVRTNLTLAMNNPAHANLHMI
jgi:6-phosphogluconate dehydrogenase